MRKLIAVGILVGGLLAGAGTATAQLANQGGIGDPLSLAASGVLIPFQTGAAGGLVALVEVASPVASNPNLHMMFFNNTCARIGDSVFTPHTVNDISFTDPGAFVSAGSQGLVAIAKSDISNLFLIPLQAPIHSRVYQFNPSDGRSRVFEPITLDTAEFGIAFSSDGRNTWNPLRTAATFFAPKQDAVIQTQLTLVCPRTSIMGTAGAAFGSTIHDTSNNPISQSFSDTGFPVIRDPFKAASVTNDMRGIMYNTDEVPITDISFTCDCLTADLPISNISPLYGTSALAVNGTYTEIQVLVGNSTNGSSTLSTQRGSFTGYRGVFAVGSPLNNFFGRLSNGSRGSILTSNSSSVSPKIDGAASSTR